MTKTGADHAGLELLIVIHPRLDSLRHHRLRGYVRERTWLSSATTAARPSREDPGTVSTAGLIAWSFRVQDEGRGRAGRDASGNGGHDIREAQRAERDKDHGQRGHRGIGHG